jgi:hypothetical protein
MTFISHYFYLDLQGLGVNDYQILIRICNYELSQVGQYGFSKSLRVVPVHVVIRFGDDVDFALIGSLQACEVLGNDDIAPGALDPVLSTIEEGDGQGAGGETVLCLQGVEGKHQGVKTDEQKVLCTSIPQ